MDPVTGGVAGAALGAHTLFGYNRENYKFDRKMRQKNEFGVMKFRNMQAALWRDDVRDLIEFTVGKLDCYTLVNGLQFGFCIELFTAGRLQPGTPSWLLWLYMLSLSGAFVYLFMSVYFAVVASVISSAGSVRLLTQLVRLPVPTWHQLEATRTYGMSVETLGIRRLLRVPFISPLFRSMFGGSKPSATGARPHDAETADPWGLERTGGHIYELQPKPTVGLRHVNLVRRAQGTWQGQEAFARVTMTMGTVNLLYAVMYYCLGYVTVGSGEVWGAFFIAGIMSCTAFMLLCLDLSLTKQEYYVLQVFVFSGPLFSSVACMFWCTYKPLMGTIVLIILPVAFASHGMLLAYVVALIGPTEQANGSIIPMRWRTVLYMDVFGWLFSSPEEEGRGAEKPKKAPPQGGGGEKQEKAAPTPRGDHDFPTIPDVDECGRLGSEEDSVDLHAEALRAELALWQSGAVLPTLGAADQERVRNCVQVFEEFVGAKDESIQSSHRSSECGRGTLCPGGGPAPTSPSPSLLPRWLHLKGHSDMGTEFQYFQHSRTGEVVHDVSGLPAGSDLPVSLSFTEERVEEFCAKGAHHGEAPRAPWISRFPRRHTPPFEDSEGAERPAAGVMLSNGGGTLPGGASSLHPAARAAAFPQPYDGPSRPVRPEDAEWGNTAAACGGSAHEDLWDDNMETPLRGIGIPGTVHTAKKDTFKGETYFPLSGAATEREAVLNSHDHVAGKTPWLFFRNITLLLAGLYGVAFFWCLGRLAGIPDFTVKPLPMEAVRLFNGSRGWDDLQTQWFNGIGAGGLPEYLQLPNQPPLLPPLAGGSMVEAAWPHQSHFKPLALSCDHDGQRFVVADDFGIYTADLAPVRGAAGAGRGPGTGGEGRHPESAQRAGEPPPPSELRGAQQRLRADFRRAPLCDELEGKTPRDLGVTCSRDPRNATRKRCNAIVLYAEGHLKLTECPLQSAAAGGTTATWDLSNNWLNDGFGDELIKSVALDHECSALSHDAAALTPNLLKCVFVGTSRGRLVHMRPHVEHAAELVPSAATTLPQRRQARKKRAAGAAADGARGIQLSSLHTLPSGYVIVLKMASGGGGAGPPARPSTMLALDAQGGQVVGEWELPQGAQWSGLCGGGGALYMVGRGAGNGAPSLWRFPMPEELRRGPAEDTTPQSGGSEPTVF